MRSIYILTALCISAPAFAKPVIGLPFRELKHPAVDYAPMSNETPLRPTRNDVMAVFRQQTPVKDQANRGTCSIFSATALLETLLIMNNLAAPEIDLSEEWLQYLTTQTTAEEGSTAEDNFKLLRQWGQPAEASLPYGTQAWTSKREGLAAKRCGHMKRSWQLRSCLTSHRDPALLALKDEELLDPDSVNYDPEFLNARNEAIRNRDAYLLLNSQRDGIVKKVSEIQDSLLHGIPLVLDITFYYGAWNYDDGGKYKIGDNPELWNQGVVTYPEKGSYDRKKSDAGGHSVLVVGFDSEREVTYSMNMRDGTRKKFTRKGVYYFKNSWGTTTWSKDFTIDGVPMPGYGMILMDNAHEFGEFFKLAL